MATTLTERRASSVLQITHDVACLQLSIVNVYFVGTPAAWVLVDAGQAVSHGSDLQAAAELFGPKSRPSAVVLTHGHFVHVGALPDLAELWDVPIFAHSLELPYLTWRSSYPPPDPTVGG